MPTQPTSIAGPEELAMLERVLEDALKAVVGGRVAANLELDQLRERLGRIIMDGYTAGDRDPEALKNAAVESIRVR
jgi:hypothetical protein